MNNSNMEGRKYVLFSGFPTHHFPDEIAEKLREWISIRDNLVFVSAWPADFDRNDDEAAGMHGMFAERGMGFSRFSVIDRRTDPDEAGRMIREASCIFLMGGNATLQMRLIHDKLIYDALHESSAVVLGVSAGSMNMGKTAVDIWESLVPYEGLGFADVTMIGHFSYDDTERLRLMKEISMERPICAMEDESAIFFGNGKADIIGIIHRIDRGGIGPFTEADVRV
jgi:peptidase E